MDEPSPSDALERALAVERPRLIGLAYRITGSRLDAEDIVQEAWVRTRRAEPATIERPGAWLTTVVARLALDHLKSARRTREVYVGPWLPEPVATSSDVADAGSAADPAQLAVLSESLTFGFLRLLEALTPTERVVFVLADVFDVPFAEIADTVGRSPEACRQVAGRARRHIRAEGVRHEVSPGATRVADRFFAAVSAGDVDGVVALLADDAVMLSDGGASARAARRPVIGPDRIARLLTNVARRVVAFDARTEPAVLNGEPGVVIWVGDVRVLAMAVRVDGGAVARVHSIVSPDKLAALDVDTALI
jgi:RNA polymerase sigma-70 factor, ECF subfamily